MLLKYGAKKKAKSYLLAFNKKEER